MTLGQRIIAGFLIILAMTALFGVYVQYALSEMGKVAEDNRLVGEMRVLMTEIQSDAELYQATGDRMYLHVLNRNISDFKRIHEDMKKDVLTADLRTRVGELVLSLADFQDVLGNYMVLNDQNSALKMQLYNTTLGLTVTMQAQNLHSDPEVLPLYIEALGLVLDVTVSQNFLTNRLEGTATDTSNYKIKRLEEIAQILYAQGNTTDAQLLGIRLRGLSQKQSEFYVKAATLQEQEQLYLTAMKEMNGDLELLSNLAFENGQKAVQNRNSQLFLLTTAILAFILFLGVAISIFIPMQITRGMQELVRVTGHIAAGDANARIQPQGPRDMKGLCISINEMAEALKASAKSLKTANEQLEATVERKTLELNHANRELAIINENLNLEKEHLSFMAMTDSLTKLKNRAFLMETLRQCISEAKRYSLPFCVLLLDLDHFKLVNDTYGHMTGDDVLKVTSEAFMAEIRASDVVGRYGGEEFLLLFPGTGLKEAIYVAERIRRSIEGLIFPQKGMRITVSGGLASYQGESEEEVLSLVDELMYRAKAAGRNRVLTVETDESAEKAPEGE